MKVYRRNNICGLYVSDQFYMELASPHGRVSVELSDRPRTSMRSTNMPRKAKAALAKGACPDCGKVLDIVDTWERAWPDQGCGYAFNLYLWPWVTGDLPPSGD